MRDIGHFIGGRRVEGTSGQHGPIFNPATGEQTGAGRVRGCRRGRRRRPGGAQGPARVGRDAAAAPDAGHVPLKELLDQNLDRLARLVTEEHGKVLDDAKGSVIRGLEVVEFACGLPQMMKGEFSHQVGTGVDLLSVRIPWACAPASRRSTSRP
jgi:malonate-semialdehyde dehydrogenase (acetylating)/methylmalonate-semialdehyde dehydrogenase